ncbi:MAG: T9SS type A sorting domain-containing protein [Bacteroidetes bacterium]|nr:T9SS type A sorting domain-containing protein [Bacteroidota bacterium]
MKEVYFIALAFVSFSVSAQSYFLPTANQSPIANRNSVVEPIVATIPYQGYEETQEYFGEGEYEIFLDEVDGVLDHPIIVLDGFDPGDSRDITGLYNSLEFDGQNMADILRAEGFDIVVLNAPQYSTGGNDIDGGADYIQRNAMVLIEMINLLNAEKVGDAELVVLGPSMGGLIARYALSYMEANSLPHETRLYISFDSPHLGANVPISLQYLINYLAIEFGNEDATLIVEGVLNSPAAKEMLVDHLSAHVDEGASDQNPNSTLPAGAPNFRDAFQTELNNLGFPTDVRNVSMINGSGNGTTTGTPGMQVVNTTLDIITGTTAEVALHFMPEATETIEVTSWTTFLGPIPIGSFSADGEATATSDGVDSAPGGTANISTALGDGDNPIIVAFIEALDQDAYAFIPTLSALGIDTPNWYTVPNVDDSPFVNTYIPDENEDHVTVTAASAAFALEEIRNGVLSISNGVTNDTFQLMENPVSEMLTLTLDDSLRNQSLSLAIYTTAGQLVVYEELKDVSNEITLIHGLASGVYILQLTDRTGPHSINMVVK